MALRSGAPRAVPQRRRVLVVDEAEGIRTYLKGVLGDSGYEAALAEDGEAAVSWVEESGPPDAVILDVRLSGMDGFEALRRIKQLHPALRRIKQLHPALPVIMLSAVGKASTIVEALQLGAADFLN